MVKFAIVLVTYVKHLQLLCFICQKKIIVIIFIQSGPSKSSYLAPLVAVFGRLHSLHPTLVNATRGPEKTVDFFAPLVAFKAISWQDAMNARGF